MKKIKKKDKKLTGYKITPIKNKEKYYDANDTYMSIYNELKSEESSAEQKEEDKLNRYLCKLRVANYNANRSIDVAMSEVKMLRAIIGEKYNGDV